MHTEPRRRDRDDGGGGRLTAHLMRRDDDVGMRCCRAYECTHEEFNGSYFDGSRRVSSLLNRIITLTGYVSAIYRKLDKQVERLAEIRVAAYGTSPLLYRWYVGNFQEKSIDQNDSRYDTP